LIEWLAEDQDITLDAHESRAFDFIEREDTADIISAVVAAGFPAETFFEHGNLEGVDLRHSDIRSVSFFGANLTGVILHRDQYDMVRRTRPKTLDRAKIQETRNSTSPEQFTLISDTPIDPAEARRDFRHALYSCLLEREGQTTINWALLTQLVQRIDRPLGGIWALDLILEAVPGLPPASLVDECASTYELDSILDVSGWSQAVEITQLVGKESDRARINLLMEIDLLSSPPDQRTFTKAIELSDGIDVFRCVLSLCKKIGLELEPANASSALSRLGLSFDSVDRLAAEMHKVAVGLTTDVFNRLVDGIRTIRECRAFFGLMKRLHVAPDFITFEKSSRSIKSADELQLLLDMIATFNQRPTARVYANAAKYMEGLRQARDFLDTMHRNEVDPDISVFIGLTNSFRRMVNVPEFLSMMARWHVEPDLSIYLAIAQHATTTQQALQMIDYMRGVGLEPDTRVLCMFAQRCKSILEFKNLLQTLSLNLATLDPKVFIAVTRNFKDKAAIKDLAVQMIELGVGFEFEFFLTALTHCRSFEDSRVVYSIYKDYFLSTPHKKTSGKDYSFYRQLSFRCGTINELRETISYVVDDGFHADLSLFKAFMDRMSILADGPAVVRLMQENDCAPDADIFATFSARCRTIEETDLVLKLMEQAVVPRESYHYSGFLCACKNAIQAIPFLKAIRKLDGQPEVRHLNTLLNATITPQDFEQVLSIFKEFQISANSVTNSIIFRRRKNG
jgi:Pentapeptide repeats (8 copies)